MQIHQEMLNQFKEFNSRYSTDIEFDSVYKYTNKIAEFIEVYAKTHGVPVTQEFVDKCFEEAIQKADRYGITNEMHRRSLEILSKYWIHGKFVSKYKI